MEILSGVAIISILVVLLMVPIKGVIVRAQSTRCISNLRQMGGAALQYANDHQGNLPPAYYQASPSDSWVFYRLLNEYVGPYDSNTQTRDFPKLYRCPADQKPFLEGKASYACNQCLGNGFTSANIFNPAIRRSQSILFIDASRTSLRPGWGGGYENPEFRHGGFCNAVMMDGSAVKSFKQGGEEIRNAWGL